MTGVVKFAIIFYMDQEPLSPYQNPELIEQSHGDDMLLHRLVARFQAEERLQADPKNSSKQQIYDIMNREVETRMRALGIELPEKRDEA